MERAHGAAQEALGLQLGLVAVEREQVVQVEGHPGALRQATVRAPRGEVLVAPGGVMGDLVEEQVDGGGRVVAGRAVWAGGGHRRPRDIGPGGALQEVAQGGGDGGDGEVVAHRPAPSRCLRYCSSVNSGSGPGSGAGSGAGGTGVPRTSIRPIVTRTCGGAPCLGASNSAGSAASRGAGAPRGGDGALSRRGAPSRALAPSSPGEGAATDAVPGAEADARTGVAAVALPISKEGNACSPSWEASRSSRLARASRRDERRS